MVARVLAAAAALSLVVTSGFCQGLTAAKASAPSAAASRAAAPSGPAWESLSATQRAELAPLQKEWPSLSAPRKEKWLVLAGRFPNMSATERDRVKARMNEWARMTPLERGRARQNFQEMQIGRAEDRQALWDAYQALPAEERTQLAQRAKPASAASSTAVARAASSPADVKPLSGSKRNIVQTQTQSPPPRPIGPTLVQAKPGATTTLLTTTASPPAHNQPGLPKIAATEGFVNPSTLLPRRGPQGAAAGAAGAAAAPASSAASPLQ